MTESTLRIVWALRAVPPGRVSSYRDIAIFAGLPRGARQVVRVLHSMSQTQNLPWHRIVKADGSIALPPGGGRELQIALLRSEGVEVTEGKKAFLPGYKALRLQDAPGEPLPPLP